MLEIGENETRKAGSLAEWLMAGIDVAAKSIALSFSDLLTWLGIEAQNCKIPTI